MNTGDILKLKGFKLLNGKNTDIDYFSISTKEIRGKTMFFPLKGKTDGHDYILDGVDNGICGFFVEPSHGDIVNEAIKRNEDIIIIEVKDTLLALQILAKSVRDSLDTPVIALTGSYGKTSQREMIYSVLREEFKVLTTKGNLNNHIGMPLTLVNYKDEDVILLELGSNHMGEIAFLRDICQPTITLVTNVGTAHIGNFKRISNIFKEKMSIAKGSSVFLRNMDDNLIRFAKVKGAEVINYGMNESDVSNIIMGKKNRYTVKVLSKRYKVTINSDINYLMNYSLCALKIGVLLNMDMKNIIKGIDNFKCTPSRMEVIPNGKYIIVNDCYNASYETMISGLDYFNLKKVKNKVVILGDILELGRVSKRIHKMVAKYINKNDLNFKEIHLVGKEMKVVYNYLKKKGFNVFYYVSVDDINKNILKDNSVYLKASNGTHLGKLIEKNR